MLPIREFLTDLAITTAVFTVFVVGTILWKPRIWLHDFPADIQAMVPPKTAQEQRLTNLLGVPFFLLFFGLPLLLMLDLPTTLGADFSFFTAWLYVFGLFFGVNLWDLLALDWLGFSLVDPQNPPLKGSEGAAGWRDYMFHFVGFLKGCVISAVGALLVSGLVVLLA